MVAPGESPPPWSPVSAVSSVSRGCAPSPSAKSMDSFPASPEKPALDRHSDTAPAKDCWSLNDFDLGRRIDKGKFGVVYLARCRRSQLIVAVKALSKRMAIATKVQRQVEREVNIQYNMRHPNILRLYAYFWDQKKVYLVLEYAAKGDLYKHLRRQRPVPRFSEPVAAYYMAQIISAVHYLHNACVIHRDIKPENMMLTLENTVKLGDFGWSVHCPSASRRETFCGTLDYLAPEVVCSESYDFGVDVWGIGVLLFELVTGGPPFDHGEHKTDTYKRIKAVNFDFPAHVSAGVQELVRGFLQKDPAKRLDLGDALVHPWMQRAEKDTT